VTATAMLVVVVTTAAAAEAMIEAEATRGRFY
jgi:hypothetical protein